MHFTSNGNLMKVSFVWHGDQPDSPPASQIQESIAFGLDHFQDARGLKPAALVVHLSADKLALEVVGVGHGPADKPLFISRYSLVGPGNIGSCGYYEQVQ